MFPIFDRHRTSSARCPNKTLDQYKNGTSRLENNADHFDNLLNLITTIAHKF